MSNNIHSFTISCSSDNFDSGIGAIEEVLESLQDRQEAGQLERSGVASASGPHCVIQVVYTHPKDQKFYGEADRPDLPAVKFDDNESNKDDGTDEEGPQVEDVINLLKKMFPNVVIESHLFSKDKEE